MSALPPLTDADVTTIIAAYDSKQTLPDATQTQALIDKYAIPVYQVPGGVYKTPGQWNRDLSTAVILNVKAVAK